MSDGRFITRDMVEKVTTDLPDGVDAVLANKDVVMRVELAAITVTTMFKIPIEDARKRAWSAAIRRGHAKAITGLARKAEEVDP